MKDKLWNAVSAYRAATDATEARAAAKRLDELFDEVLQGAKRWPPLPERHRPAIVRRQGPCARQWGQRVVIFHDQLTGVTWEEGLAQAASPYVR